LTLLAAALFFAHSAVAQQAAPGEHPAVPQRPLMLQPPTLDFGSSLEPNPRPAPTAQKDGECAPAWPCQLRLFGVIDKTGGVGLKGPVLSW
jgi:hypothetical protein